MPKMRIAKVSCQQTWVTRLFARWDKSGDSCGASLASSLGSWFHNFERLTGLGGQGAELGILRHWDLRKWGGMMRPAGFDGKTVFIYYPVCARPRLPALTTLAPEPRHRDGHRANTSSVRPWMILDECHPCRFTRYSEEEKPLTLERGKRYNRSPKIKAGTCIGLPTQV
jgi:hypothetical protein